MSTQVSAHIKAHASKTATSVGSWAPLILITAVVSAVAFHAVLHGAAVRKEMPRLRAEQIDREDRLLCEKLGVPYGSEWFAVCADVLSQARREEAKRVASETAGIL